MAKFLLTSKFISIGLILGSENEGPKSFFKSLYIVKLFSKDVSQIHTLLLCVCPEKIVKFLISGIVSFIFIYNIFMFLDIRSLKYLLKI